MKAVPLDENSDEDRDLQEDELVRKRIKVIRELSELEQPNKRRFIGGIVVSSVNQVSNHSACASLSAAEKKGLKEVADLERELDLKNTFSKETNRRDEDAEMNKYIDEQIRLRREAAKKEREKLEKKQEVIDEKEKTDLAEMFTLPTEATDKIDDILLHSLSKNLASTSNEKSEAMLSSQMLNGIPEVDLGIEERIRTIEATQEAKLRLASSSGTSRLNLHRNSSIAPVNYSSNFQQHRNKQVKTLREERNNSNRNEVKTVTEAVVVVGEEPSEIEYRLPSTGERPPPRGKASDDYYLSKFKKNNRK